jgi:hypothetical protein
MRPLLFIVLSAASQALYPAPAPVKLAVEVSSRSVGPGEKIAIQIGLLDAANQPVGAPKPLVIALQARLPSGKVETLQNVAMQAGQSFNTVAASLPGSGLVYVWARHPELLPGGEFVRVRALNAGARPQLNLPAAPTTSPRPIARTSLRSIPKITLRFSPDREFLADGKDAVSIEAFRLGDDQSLSSDIRLSVYDSSNTLNPKPLTIHAGDPVGQSLLRSSEPGPVTVEFLASNPPVELEGNKKLDVAFVPPITRLTLTASPPQISLLDTADLVVSLCDDQGRPLATKTPRQVVFSVISGKGQIDRRELQISPGHFEGRTSLVPQWPGQVTVSASTTRLFTVTSLVQVSVPTTLLACSAAGGLVGGLLSRRTRRRLDRWRALVGLVTGPLFYWASVFIGLTLVKQAVVLNPLSAVALSAIGGWLQTEVFAVVWDVIRPRKKA